MTPILKLALNPLDNIIKNKEQHLASVGFLTAEGRALLTELVLKDAIKAIRKMYHRLYGPSFIVSNFPSEVAGAPGFGGRRQKRLWVERKQLGQGMFRTTGIP